MVMQHVSVYSPLKNLTSWLIGIPVLGSVIFLAVSSPGGIPDGYESMNGLHYHSYLSITIDKKPVTIPENVGHVPNELPIHIHGKNNIVHMEFGGKVKKDDIRLGKFFEAWGKDFSKDSLLGRRAEGGHSIVMFVNNVRSNEYEHYVMKDGDRIDLSYR